MPEIVIVFAPTDNVEPVLTVRLVHAAMAVVVTVKPPSMVTLSAATGAGAPGAPPLVVDHVEVELQLPVATENRFAAEIFETDEKGKMNKPIRKV